METFPPTGELVAEGLTLRPAAAHDTAAVLRLFCDDDQVTRYVAWRPRRTAAEAARFLEILIDGERVGRHSWFAQTPGDDLPSASIAALRDGDEVEVEVSYVVAPDCWGRGIATAAVRAIAAAALADGSVTRVRAFCDAENHASARVLVKAGFERDAFLPAHGRHNVSTELRDCLRFIRTRAD